MFEKSFFEMTFQTYWLQKNVWPYSLGGQKSRLTIVICGFLVSPDGTQKFEFEFSFKFQLCHWNSSNHFFICVILKI